MLKRRTRKSRTTINKYSYKTIIVTVLMQVEENQGYILRVSHDDWVEQIFELKKYYSGINRNWRVGTPILLAKKTQVGDSFIGYGITDKVEMLFEMSAEEEHYCKENGWKVCITFKPLIRFLNPVPIKMTPIGNDRRKGMFLHGVMLSEDTVDTILEIAEEYTPLT